MKRPDIYSPLVREEDDTIRDCPKNRAQLGPIKSWWLWHSYWGILKNVQWSLLLEMVATFASLLALICLFPLAPYIQAYMRDRDAVKQMNLELPGRAMRQMHHYGRSKWEERQDTLKWIFDADAHVLYNKFDKDLPERICNQHGELVYAVCRVCGRAEIELDEPCMTRLRGWK